MKTIVNGHPAIHIARKRRRIKMFSTNLRNNELDFISTYGTELIIGNIENKYMIEVQVT